MAKIIINKTTLPDGTNGECGYLDADSETLIATEKVFAKGITYTLSFLVKADGGKTIRFCNGYNETELTHTTTTEWTKAIFTFTANDTFVGFIVPTGKYYLYQAQVETGELATNWNPSVNDSDKEIAELNSLILQTSEEIMTKVSASYATKDAFTGLESRVSKAETSITQTAEEIRLEASKTYSTKAELESSVQNLQDQIDGALGSYSGSEVPTLNNYPANEWTTTALKDAAIGSLYFVNSKGGDYAGFSYRWEKLSDGTYQWALLKDTEVTQALKELEDLKKNLANNYSTTAEMNAAIKVSADSITNTVNQIENRVTTAESTIKQQADEIALRVKTTDYTGEEIASLINQTAENIKIIAEHIALEGLTTVNGKTKFNTDGSIEATDGKFTGQVTATSGSFKGEVNATSGSFKGKVSADTFDIGGNTISITKQSLKISGRDYVDDWIGLIRDYGAEYCFSFLSDLYLYGNDAYFNTLAVKDNIYSNLISATRVASTDIYAQNILKTSGVLCAGNSGSSIKLIKCGTSILYGRGDDSQKLFTMATVQGWYSSASQTNTAIFTCNGDGDAAGFHPEGTSYLGSDGYWYIHFNKTIGSSTPVRINWMLICWS